MRCLLVDDNETFVATARRVLDPDGVEVAGTASNSTEAVLRAGELRPDIVLIDSCSATKTALISSAAGCRWPSPARLPGR